MNTTRTTLTRFQRTIRYLHRLGWWWAAIGAAVLLGGCMATSRTVTVITQPTSATVKIDNAVVGTSPHTSKLEWKEERGVPLTHTVTVESPPDYESKKVSLTLEDAKAAKSPWELYVRLEPLFTNKEVRFVTEPAGAAVSVQDAAGLAPCNLRVRFTRPNSAAPWSALTATASFTNYLTTTARFTSEQPEVKIELPRIREELPVDISCNTNATIKVSGQEIGTTGPTPVRCMFIFTRASGSVPWSTFQVSVEKDGWYFKKPGVKTKLGEPQPFSVEFTREDAAKGKLHVELTPVRFVRSPVIQMMPTNERMEAVTNNVLSQVEESGGGSRFLPTQVTSDPDLAKYETRVSVMTNGLDVVFSIPRWLPQTPERTYFNLWAQVGNGVQHLTEATQQDLEAAVSPDGQWIYFSSDRERAGRYNIWRMRAAGGGGMTKITGGLFSIIDTEPAVSPDGRKLAYTSYIEGRKLPEVYVANTNGTLATFYCVGHSPCWSPDGSKLLYVAPYRGRDKIWTINADGTEPTRVMTGEGDYTDLYPVWTPDGKRIVFASDRAEIEEGERSFDIWIAQADGTGPQPLTPDGSYDTRPAVSPDGKWVYFVSNRRAHKPGAAALGIYRIELPAP